MKIINKEKNTATNTGIKTDKQVNKNPQTILQD